MKKLLPAASLLICSIAAYGIDEDIEPEMTALEESQLDEIATLEPHFLTQQPISREEIDLSSLNFTPRHKNAFLAVSLSTLMPGLGHVYLGDFRTAGTLFGSSSLMGGLGSWKKNNETFRVSNLVTAQNTWFYGIYAAYRDVRAYNDEEGYIYKMPKDSFGDLAWAPFQWSVLKKPEVWGGFLGALTVGMGLSYFIFSDEAASHVNFSTGSHFPLLAFPVGIGEESFFRGYLQSVFTETLTPWGGILISSLAFGAMHIFNASLMEPEDRGGYYSFGVPFITAFGAYFGWLTYKNCSLKESVALHSWYDFTLFLLSYAAPRSVIGKPSFAISFSF